MNWRWIQNEGSNLGPMSGWVRNGNKSHLNGFVWSVMGHCICYFQHSINHWWFWWWWWWRWWWWWWRWWWCSTHHHRRHHHHHHRHHDLSWQTHFYKTWLKDHPRLHSGLNEWTNEMNFIRSFISFIHSFIHWIEPIFRDWILGQDRQARWWHCDDVSAPAWKQMTPGEASLPQ